MLLEAVAVLGLIAGSCYGQGQRGLRYRGHVFERAHKNSTSTSSETPAPYLTSDMMSLTTSTLVATSVTVSITGTAPKPYSSALPSSSSSQSYSISGTAPQPYSSGLSVTYSSPAYSYAPSGYAPSAVGPATASGNATSVYGPSGTGVSPHRPVKSPALNATCSGSTLNVLGASLDWWYTETLYNAVSTLSVQYNRNHSQTGWTVLPATTPFDITSALTQATCTSSLTYNTVYNATAWDVSCYPAPTPVAAATTVLTQTAYKHLNRTTGTGKLPDVVATPSPATITIPDSGGTYGEGTAFVYFSAYEIMTKSKTTYGNGSVGCAEATQIYHMAEPFSFEYTGGDVNGSKVVGAGVTGDVAPAFLKAVGATGAEAGSWVAAPTVALVVQNVYAAEAVYAAAHSVLSLETPTPTLPSFLTPAPPKTTGHFTAPTGFTGHLESSASFLEVPSPSPTGHNGGGGGGTSKGGSPGVGPVQTTPAPFQGGDTKTIKSFVAHTEQTDITLKIPVNPTQTVVTTVIGGNTITATAESIVKGGGGQPTKGGGVGGVISAIFSALQPLKSPTNAAQVFSQAETTFDHANPTASAILKGLGGPGSPNEGNHNGAGGSGPGSNGPGGSSPNGIPPIVVGGTTFTANAASQFSLGPSATLTPGGTAVIGGTTLSLNPALTAVVVNGQTSLMKNPAITPAPVITVGGTTFSANGGSTFEIGGQTLTPGGVITVGGTTISLAPAATAVVVNGVTHSLSNPTITAAPVLTIGGTTYAPNSGPTYIIGGSTLTPGGTITVDGTTISLSPGASSIVINGLTQSLGPKNSPASITAPPVLTIGGEKFTAINSGETYVINGETFSSGEIETVKINGKTYVISFLPGATVLMIETEGPNGKITATTYETLFPGSGSQATVTYVVGASATAGARPSGSASASIQAPLQNSASATALKLSGVCVGVGSLALAIWL